MPSTGLPRDTHLDSTLALAADGYEFILKRCRRFGTDAFRTRLMLQPFICMTGEEAARVFYDPERFIRKDAAPRPAKATLFGFGVVQNLDGEAHRQRKAMFLSLMTPEGIGRLVALFSARWHAALPVWASRERVVLYDAAKEVLCRAVFEWAGVPLEAGEVGRVTDQASALFEGAAQVGPRHWRARLARTRLERWLGEIIERVRAGELRVEPGSALHAVATHRDPDGAPLEARVAAAELLNVLRPTIAVAVYIAFVAVALHDHPEHAQRFRAGDDGLLEPFVQEVRRFYPFFPFIGARVRRDFQWRGYHFPQGTKVLLDLYGTNHDARLWEEPGRFRPERFVDREIGPFSLIPQGGGDHGTNHRCPGEWITIEVMKESVRLLTRAMRYEVPAQDLRIPMTRMPAVPESGFVIRAVRMAGG